MGNSLNTVFQAISNLIDRAVLRKVTSSSRCQTLQISFPGNEGKSDIEHMEPYGFTSAPPVGAEAVVACFDGDRSHGVALVVSDRRYRITGLKSGEVAFYDDLGQSVTLTREGIVVNGAGKQITFKGAPRARFEMDIESTGNVTDNCDTSGKTMAAMRETYDDHDHTENGAGNNTDKPNQKTGAA